MQTVTAGLNKLINAGRDFKRNANMEYTTQEQVRAAFWDSHPAHALMAVKSGRRSKRQNAQPADTRCAFVEFVDMLERNGSISRALAGRVTL